LFRDIDECVNIHIKIINGNAYVISHINEETKSYTSLVKYLYDNIRFDIFDYENISLIEQFHEYID
jgi:hypothetical protein